MRHARQPSPSIEAMPCSGADLDACRAAEAARTRERAYLRRFSDASVSVLQEVPPVTTGDFGGSSSPVIGSPPQLFPILPAWEPKHSLLWGQQAICMEHRLHEHPLFSPESLAALIEHYPAGQYMLVHVGARGGEKE